VATKLNDWVNVVGVPKTIDNDLQRHRIHFVSIPAHIAMEATTGCTNAESHHPR